MANIEVQYKTADGKFVTKFSGETQKDIFESVADFQSVFEGNDICQFPVGNDVCGGLTYFNTRLVDGNNYYEKKCYNCGATLTFHQNKRVEVYFLNEKTSGLVGPAKKRTIRMTTEVFNDTKKMKEGW